MAALRRRTGIALPVGDREYRPAVEPPCEPVASQDGEWRVRLLNEWVSLTRPVDWFLSRRPAATALQRLAIHYHDFLHNLPRDTARDLIIDWIDRCPPGAPQYWMTSWNSYGLSIRVVNWIAWFSRHGDELATDDRRKIVASIGEQVRFLERNLETDICGNHLIKNIRCLLVAGSFFTGSRAARWRSRGLALLRWQLPVQVLADGVHFELSPAYHCQVFCDLLDCATLSPDAGRDRLLDVLRPAAQAIADLTHPDGRISLMSDGGLTMTHAPQACLDAWKRVTGEAVSASRFFEYPRAGYFGARLDDAYILVDCGQVAAPSLPAHGHADILSLELSLDGHRWIVDAGVGEYEAGPIRTWTRSTRSHNTVTVGDRDQAEMVGSFRIGSRAAGHLVKVAGRGHEWAFEGYHDAFGSGRRFLRHRRLIRLRQDQLHVTDVMEGNSPEPCVARWLVHPSVEIKPHGPNEVWLVAHGRVVVFRTERPIAIRESQWFPDFGVCEPTKQLEIPLGSSPCSNNSWITFAETGDAERTSEP